MLKFRSPEHKKKEIRVVQTKIDKYEEKQTVTTKTREEVIKNYL